MADQVMGRVDYATRLIVSMSQDELEEAIEKVEARLDRGRMELRPGDKLALRGQRDAYRAEVAKRRVGIAI